MTTEPPLGIFDEDGHRVAEVPGNTAEAYALLRRLAAANPGARYEVLIQCPNHPGSSRVDCLAYEPLDT